MSHCTYAWVMSHLHRRVTYELVISLMNASNRTSTGSSSDVSYTMDFTERMPPYACSERHERERVRARKKAESVTETVKKGGRER